MTDSQKEKLRFINIRLPGWESLSKIAQNKIFRSSYFWLIFVPIVAKALKPTELNLKVFDATINLTITLPFSWRMFFYGAVFFSIGNIIYEIFCPDLIKHFKDYSHFKSEGRERRWLFRAFGKFFLKWRLRGYGKLIHERQVSGFLRSLVRHEHNPNLAPDAKIDLLNFVQDYTIPSHEESSAFWLFREILDQMHLIPRLLTFILYLLGLICTAYVIVQNILFVVNKV